MNSVKGESNDILEFVLSELNRYKSYLSIASMKKSKVRGVDLQRQYYYSRWALDELKRYIILDKKNHNNPVTSIEDFADIMFKNLINSKTERQRWIFTIAYDIVRDFGLLFI